MSKSILDKQISVMLTSAQLDVIKSKCEARNMSMSSYLRSAIEMKLDSEKENLGDMIYKRQEVQEHEE